MRKWLRRNDKRRGKDEEEVVKEEQREGKEDEKLVNRVGKETTRVSVFFPGSLIAMKRLYERVCPSVGRSVGRSVGWLVGW